jgi:hypothetical protein
MQKNAAIVSRKIIIIKRDKLSKLRVSYTVFTGTFRVAYSIT